MRPYLLASLIDSEPDRPALVVAGDDRAARDLAADLKQFLAPRPVRVYPARGVRYESHLAPPPHLVGLRVAALDALLGEGPPAVVVASAVALSEKVPDPELRPHGFAIEKGGLLDLDETAEQLVACGYERVDQVEDRGQFALRGDILDVYPATEERAVRCELFDVEVERLTYFSTFTQRSLEEAERVEIAPAAELAPEQRELAEIAAQEDEDERPDITELLPVDRFMPFLDLLPEDALVMVAAEEEIAPALKDHWDDVTASLHDKDAHHLYVSVDLAPRCGAVEHLRRPAARVQGAVGRHRGALAQGRGARAGEAGPLRLPHLGRVGAARRGRARAVQPDPHAGAVPRRPPGAARARRGLRRGEPARGLPGAGPEAGRGARAPPAAPAARGAARRPGRHGGLHGAAGGRRGGARGTRDRPLRRLRDQDRGRSHARLPGAGVQGRGPRLRAERPAPQDQPLRGRRRRRPSALEARRQAVGADEVARPPRRAGAGRRADQPLRRAQAPGGPRLPAGLRVAARLRAGLQLPRDARPDGRDRAGQGGHGGGAPDGPPDLRRRGLRQDRGRPPGRVQGGERRQAGVVPRSHHRARPAALRHLLRAPARLPLHDRGGLALPLAQGGARGAGGFSRGQGGHPDRHPPRALPRRAAEGPRPPDRGRGAALRREAEGAAAPAEAEGGRALAVRDPHPADAPDVARGTARHLGDRDAARGPPPGEDLRRRLRRGPGHPRDRARARARGPGLLSAQPRRDDRRDGGADPGDVPEGARWPWPTARWTRSFWRR